MSDDNPDHVKPATSDSTAELRSELTALRARYAAGAFAAIWTIRAVEREISWREHGARNRVGIR
jgi:hypothetical protein